MRESADLAGEAGGGGVDAGAVAGAGAALSASELASFPLPLFFLRSVVWCGPVSSLWASINPLFEWASN